MRVVFNLYAISFPNIKHICFQAYLNYFFYSAILLSLHIKRYAWRYGQVSRCSTCQKTAHMCPVKVLSPLFFFVVFVLKVSASYFHLWSVIEKNLLAKVACLFANLHLINISMIDKKTELLRVLFFVLCKTNANDGYKSWSSCFSF